MVGSIIAVAGLYRTQSQDRDRAKQTIATQLALAQILSLLQDAETGQRGFLLTGSEAYLRPFTEATTAGSCADISRRAAFGHDGASARVWRIAGFDKAEARGVAADYCPEAAGKGV